MGQIVIDIPNKKKRHYVITDANRANELLEDLDASTVRVKNKLSKATRQRLQDIRDGDAAMKSLEEYKRTGVSYSVDELRKKYGLL